MATAEDLIARLLRSRERSIDLGDGFGVTIRRPAAAEVSTLRARGVRGFLECVVAWSGFSEATLFGAGDSASLPFDEELWMTVASDRSAWVNKIVDELAKDIKAKAAESKAAAKN